MEKYYNILNLNKDASNEEIKKSYHNLILKYHPDKNNSLSASSKFKRINIAYKILIDNNFSNNENIKKSSILSIKN